jgi:glycolate oxidase iron-sulfur subunit
VCCGSAGTYDILQPDIASRLRDRKIADIAMVMPVMIVAGNIGCMVQIAEMSRSLLNYVGPTLPE